jgi:hypothetical protein
VSASIWDWPALGPESPKPRRLEVERAIWGKVHGAMSDFRWIAHSPGIDPQARRLELELLLGSEDAPDRATCWRALVGSFCAVSCYPSRATDAARRSGFLEKQNLEWRPPAGTPAALGALLLLPQVARLTDQDWWDYSADPAWSQADFALTLEPGLAPSLEVSDGDLESNAKSGLDALREAVGEESRLAELYSTLLAGQRPAILAGLRRPLPPEGIAALLLPLPRNVADQLSVAGWVLSKRVDAESLRRLWDVLICDSPPSELRASSETTVTEQGREAARAVFNADPSRLRGLSQVSAAGPRTDTAGLPPAVVLSFATDDSRRWMTPEELTGGPDRPLRSAEPWAHDLEGCVEAVEAEIAKLNEERELWRRKHLQVKADLLRAAALVLAPGTLRQLGLPRSGRVPALLFCTVLSEQDWGRLDDLGETELHEAVRQSLSCQPGLFERALRSWLARWGKRIRN